MAVGLEDEEREDGGRPDRGAAPEEDLDGRAQAAPLSRRLGCGRGSVTDPLTDAHGARS